MIHASSRSSRAYVAQCTSAWLVSLVASLLLVTVLAAVIFWPGVWPEVAVLCVAVLAARPLLWGLTRLYRWINRQDFFSPLIAFPIGYLLWFTIGSIDFIQVPSFVSFGLFDPIPGYVLLYAALGLAAYFGGVLAAGRTSTNLRPDRSKIEPWSGEMFGLAIALMSVVILACYVFLIARMGIPILSANATEQRLEIDKYHLASGPFFACADTVCLLLGAQWWSASKETRARKKRTALFAYAVIFPMLFSLGGRSYFVPVLVTMIIAFHYFKGSLRLRYLVLAAVALYTVSSLYGYFRDLSVESNLGDLLSQGGLPSGVQPVATAYLYIRYSVAAFRDVAAIIPAQFPYQHGTMTLQPFMTLLPGHHEMADMFFKKLLGNDFIGAGQPATLLAPFYADFGAIGIATGMFLFGLLLGTLYRKMHQEPSAIRVLLFSWTTMLGLFGLFASIFPYIDMLLIPLGWVVIHAVAVLFRSRPTAGSAAIG